MLINDTAHQRFIDKAVAQMGVQYVLLVGADTYDYKNFLGTGSVSLVPTRYAAYGDIVRYAPADGLYVDRDRDGAPEAAIGRLPVRSVAELQSFRISQRGLDLGPHLVEVDVDAGIGYWRSE